MGLESSLEQIKAIILKDRLSESQILSGSLYSQELFMYVWIQKIDSLEHF